MAFEDFTKVWAVYGCARKPRETTGHEVEIGGTADDVTVMCLHDREGHPYPNGTYQIKPQEQITGPNYIIRLNGKGPQGNDAILCEPAPSLRPVDQTPSWSAEDKGRD